MDPVFCAHAGWTPQATIAAGRERWRALIESPDPALLRLLAVRANGAPVGYADLHGDSPGERELGYVVGPSRHWGQGIGTSIARTAVDHAFIRLGMQRLWAEALEANVASVRVLRRVGMRHTGYGDDADFLGEPTRYIQFELTREDWLAERI